MSDESTQSAESSSPRLRIIFLGIAALLAAGGALLEATAPDPETLEPAQGQAPTLHTYEIQLELASHRTQLAGLLEARRRVQLFSEEQGRVLEIGAEELERVMAGQLLVRMDPLRAEVALDHARAAVARAESESILARANLDRNQGLKRRDVASRKALDEAENAARMAAAAKLDAKASVREAEDRLAKLTISAPFSGILQSFLVEVGELIQPGERIGELLDIDRLRIAIGLTDRQVLAMTPGQRVAVHAEAQPDHLFEGEIVHVGLAMDPVTRKFPLRIELDNADRLLLPGMVAKVELTLGEPGEIMPVPLDAVVDEFGLKHAFVVEESESGSRVTKRRIDVRSIAFRPTDLDVVAGLSVGERIAISSVRQLREGMAVRPLPPSNRSTLSRVETAP
jgi:membrane fusion protein (multidrug efflux system)